MMNEPNEPKGPSIENPERTPSTEELQEPSTEKEPGQEPKAAGEPADEYTDGTVAEQPDASEAAPSQDAEPSHHAVGIGVIDAPIGAEAPDED